MAEARQARCRLLFLFLLEFLISKCLVAERRTCNDPASGGEISNSCTPTSSISSCLLLISALFSSQRSSSAEKTPATSSKLTRSSCSIPSCGRKPRSCCSRRGKDSSYESSKVRDRLLYAYLSDVADTITMVPEPRSVLSLGVMKRSRDTQKR